MEITTTFVFYGTFLPVYRGELETGKKTVLVSR